MKTIATLFSGFEGFGVGAQMAGYRHTWGVEWDAQLAAVATANGFHAIVGDVRTVDYTALERPNHLHASPVCKNASVAKADGQESPDDIETAAAVSRAILALQPDTFSLENVRGYREFQAFKNILRTLRELGYSVAVDVVNAADYGVPQTRERLIVLARRDGKRVQFPAHTHAPADEIGPMFDERRPWVGWYEAIADMVDTLPDDNFAPWQLKRLPKELRETTTIDSAGYPTPNGAAIRHNDAPSFTVGASQTHRPLRAFIVGAGGYEGRVVKVNQEAPVFTVTANSNQGAQLRAYLAPGGNAASFGVRYADEPSRVIGDVDRVGNIPRAAIGGRVVKMTPRALARFQSFPDWYQLPDKVSLACTGIGNAVPPLLAKALMEVL